MGSGPWSGDEVTVLGCPTGPGGDPLRDLASRAIPVAGLPIADTPDELIVYREWFQIPLAALPHLGPAAAEAYQSMPDTQQCPAHTRIDVTQWRGVEEGKG
jgi:eukaryotic-like serine/threonine-protein kinase